MDVGGILVGLAAVATVLMQWRAAARHKRSEQKLDGIDRAVNNVSPDTPPLWARIDNQTAMLGRLEGKFDSHVERDDTRFLGIGDALTDLRDLLRNQ